MAFANAFIQSVESPQHNVDICRVNLILWMAVPSTWGEMVYLDIIIARKFLSINGGIQLAKHNPIINSHLERPKL